MSRTDDTALGTWLWIVYASDKKDHLRDFANENSAHVILYFQFLELFSSILDQSTEKGVFTFEPIGTNPTLGKIEPWPTNSLRCFGSKWDLMEPKSLSNF